MKIRDIAKAVVGRRLPRYLSVWSYEKGWSVSVAIERGMFVEESTVRVCVHRGEDRALSISVLGWRLVIGDSPTDAFVGVRARGSFEHSAAWLRIGDQGEFGKDVYSLCWHVHHEWILDGLRAGWIRAADVRQALDNYRSAKEPEPTEAVAH